jgi:hypothetical protein
MERGVSDFGLKRARVGAAEWADTRQPARITPDEIARAARELVAAYGPAATQLMRRRTRAVSRRGDAESATLWMAVAEAIEQELAARAPRP